MNVAFQQLVNQEPSKLWHAAANGDVKEVDKALKRYQDPDAQDELGEFLGDKKTMYLLGWEVCYDKIFRVKACEVEIATTSLAGRTTCRDDRQDGHKTSCFGETSNRCTGLPFGKLLWLDT